jgi:AraC family transcriptional regulator
MHAGEGVKPGTAQGFFGSDIVRRRFGDFELHLNRATVPPATMQEHCHDEPHIVLALDSGYRSSARPSSHSAIAGEAIYNPPGTIHRDRFDDVGCRYLAIAFSPELAPKFDRAAVIEDEVAHQCLLRGIGLCTSGIVADALWAEEQMLTLVGRIETGRTILSRPSWIGDAREVIQRHSTTEGVTIAALANLLAVHPVHFARMHRAAFGHGPAEAIRRRRVQHAIGLMRATMPLAEVAAVSGFADQSHMNREFARRVGETPGRLKRRLAS